MMKKFLLILSFVIIFQTPSYSKIGKGEVKISPQILKYFIEYLRNEYAASFVMTSDGNYANYGICGVKVCMGGGPGHTATLLKSCKKKLKQKCYIFAQRKNKSKVIRWNNINYVFPKGEWEYTESRVMWSGSGKGLAMSSSTTDENILLIMKDLGFVD